MPSTQSERAVCSPRGYNAPVAADRQLDLFTDADADLAFRVRPSRRARHLTIHVSHYDGVEVVVPPRTRPQEVAEFVAAHRDWIRRARREVDLQGPPPDTRLPERVDLALTGERFEVRYGESVGRKGWRELGDGVLAIGAARAQRSRGRRALRDWLRDKGRRVMLPRLAQLSRETGLTYRRAQVRGQRTRWGSYSSRRTVSLNFCLLFAPPDLADYLYIHELCHSRHMNHSRAFWQLVARYAPDYKHQEARLNAGRAFVPAWLRID